MFNYSKFYLIIASKGSFLLNLRKKTHPSASPHISVSKRQNRIMVLIARYVTFRLRYAHTGPGVTVTGVVFECILVKSLRTQLALSLSLLSTCFIVCLVYSLLTHSGEVSLCREGKVPPWIPGFGQSQQKYYKRNNNIHQQHHLITTKRKQTKAKPNQIHFI